jgi:hypothetical protein
MTFRMEKGDFVKCRIDDENSVIIGTYDRSYFQDIFMEK